jgi:hypothetical protein
MHEVSQFSDTVGFPAELTLLAERSSLQMGKLGQEKHRDLGMNHPLLLILTRL